ncbi:VanZ family protein [Saccharibacillus sacchari]|uniref:VanZ family protein n=1 Tax=Saccharibacillus sacchari TaxID=456493 RepID=UPI0004AE26E2|nr:VanZ family protein [Saccharibacillus sacchari]
MTSIIRHRLLNAAAAFYFALLLYFLFFGFGRSEKAAKGVCFYNLSLEAIEPFRFAGLLHNPFMLFQLGNYLAFIPCGLLLPMLTRWGPLKLIGTFLLGNLLVETLQLLTGLGRFDINDVVLNASGFLTGYAAWAIGKYLGGAVFGFKRIAYTAASAVLLASIFLAAPSAAERMVQRYAEAGEIALENLQPSEGTVRWEKVPAGLEQTGAADDPYAPKLHAWSGEGTETLHYELDGGYVRFQAYGTVEGGTGGGIAFIVDGEPVYEFSFQGADGDVFDTEKIEFDVRNARELTIELSRPEDGSNGSVLLWEAGLVERKR